MDKGEPVRNEGRALNRRGTEPPWVLFPVRGLSQQPPQCPSGWPWLREEAQGLPDLLLLFPFSPRSKLPVDLPRGSWVFPATSRGQTLTDNLGSGLTAAKLDPWNPAVLFLASSFLLLWELQPQVRGPFGTS